VLAVNFGSRYCLKEDYIYYDELFRAIAINLNDIPPYVVIYKKCNFMDKSVEFWAEVVAVSSAVSRQGTYYPHQKINIAPGVVELGADQAIVFKFNIKPPSYFQQCPQ
jgi:hypothetical protein